MWTVRVLAFFTSLALPVVAAATTFVLADEQQLAQQADAIVLGEVERVEPMRANESSKLATHVRLRVVEVWKGAVPPAFELVEMGGTAGGTEARFFGVPEYRVGEQVLVFATQRPDGHWATTSLAMGKYSLRQRDQQVYAVRDLGPETTALEWDGRSLRPAPARAVYDLEDLRRSVRRTLGGTLEPRAVPRSDATSEDLGDTYTAPFALMGSPGRWFQPDQGLPVEYFVDETGDATLGVEQTNAAVTAAMAAWSVPATATIDLAVAGTMPPGKVDCSGPTQIIFNDPDNMISDPWFCSGVLAVGGYCVNNNDTVEINGVRFSRITTARILFNNGWGSCPFWNACNVAEVMTHELGHTIGIGHSGDGRATMFAYAHFDGRCAALRADDLAAVNFIYPASANLHDAAVLPPPRVKVRIRRGKPEAYVPVSVALRHGDTWGDRALFRLAVSDGTCPPGTVGAANFGIFADAPDRVDLAPGTQAKATVWLHLQSNAFHTPDSKAPARCELQVSAEVLASDNIDPYPGNEVVPVPLDVIDENDVDPKTASNQLVLGALKPLFLRLTRGKSELVKMVTVKVRNGASSDTVSLSLDPGDCPPGLVQAPLVLRSAREFFGVAMTGSSQARAQLPVRFTREMVNSLFPGSPGRCVARLLVSGQQTDADPSNNSIPVVIDLQDDNDL